MSNHVTVREVGLRDGLKSIKSTLPTAQKLDWISAAYAAGQCEIEVGSFVPARLLPPLAELDVGVRRFDASPEGIGGCPHAPGASGNAATEDTVFMLERMGYHTGIDLTALLELRKHVAEWLEGERLNGAVWRAGVLKSAAYRGSGSTAKAVA